MKTPRTLVLKASLLTTPDDSRAMQTVINIFVGTMTTRAPTNVCSFCVHPLRAFLSGGPAPPPHSLLVEQETHQPKKKNETPIR